MSHVPGVATGIKKLANYKERFDILQRKRLSNGE
jgi:hypothetical protein